MSQTTKKALADSLKKLLSVRALDKITVVDIAEDCGVNRQTFYYHFKDIYDLLEWFFVNEASRAVEGNITYETWQQGFLQIFDRILDNKQLILNTYHSIRREQLEKYLYNITYHFLMGVVEEKAKGLRADEQDKQFIANFYKFGFVGLILDWISKGMKENPADIVEKLNRLIQGDINKVLKHQDN